nr:unnamed protein product [Callosobruchus chinensis]
MEERPGSSKRVKYGDADYEEVLLKWFDEVGSDNNDVEAECDENFAINRDHSSESEIEGKNSDRAGLSDDLKKFNKPTQAVLRLTELLFGTNRSITLIGSPPLSSYKL